MGKYPSITFSWESFWILFVHAPYNPAISRWPYIPGEKIPSGNPSGGQLIALPVIAGFVGADTVARLLAVNLEEEKKR